MTMITMTPMFVLGIDPIGALQLAPIMTRLLLGI